MEITGTILKILPTEEVLLGDGTKKKKGGFVIMREGEYAKPVAFELFGDDRLALIGGLSLGMQVKVHFVAVSFEGKNGSYYTTLRCTNVFPLLSVAPDGESLISSAAVSESSRFGQMPTAIQSEDVLPFDNDLPFL